MKMETIEHILSQLDAEIVANESMIERLEAAETINSVRLARRVREVKTMQKCISMLEGLLNVY